MREAKSYSVDITSATLGGVNYKLATGLHDFNKLHLEPKPHNFTTLIYGGILTPSDPQFDVNNSIPTVLVIRDFGLIKFHTQYIYGLTTVGRVGIKVYKIEFQHIWHWKDEPLWVDELLKSTLTSNNN